MSRERNLIIVIYIPTALDLPVTALLGPLVPPPVVAETVTMTT